jgi:hypothetical protein
MITLIAILFLVILYIVSEKHDKKHGRPKHRVRGITEYDD